MSDYFVTSVFIYILNIVSTNLYLENQNKQIDLDAFYFNLFYKKSGTVSL